MVKSKRDKDVSLTKVKKKTKETKLTLVEEVRKCVETYKNLFIFTINNMRSNRFIEIRQKYKESSRFFFGRNNVLAVSLGRHRSDEQEKDLHKVSGQLKGQCGLMFTNLKKDQVIKEFAEFAEFDYSRASDVATESVVLPPGPLERFAFSMEPQLRKLGLPTKLDKGIIVLDDSYEVCKEGEPLTANQARILKLLEIKQSEFRVLLTVHWSKQKGFSQLVETS